VGREVIEYASPEDESDTEADRYWEGVSFEIYIVEKFVIR
jgi:hypothetical protein